MNFSRNSISSFAARKKRKKTRRQKQYAVLILRSVLVFILVLIAALLIVATVYVKRLIKDLPDASTINITPVGYASKIYDKDGNEIESLVTAGSNREYVTLDKIPKDLQHAFVAMEDSRFYQHNGVDIKGILRAGVTGLLSHGQVAQGASTITQQLLKK
jgi:penicillin-binding protein 1A